MIRKPIEPNFGNLLYMYTWNAELTGYRISKQSMTKNETWSGWLCDHPSLVTHAKMAMSSKSHHFVLKEYGKGGSHTT